MLHIKKNDNVKVLAGKDKGKSGKVLKIYPATNKAIVQGINFLKKHKRRTKQDDKGGNDGQRPEHAEENDAAGK